MRGEIGNVNGFEYCLVGRIDMIFIGKIKRIIEKKDVNSYFV